MYALKEISERERWDAFIDACDPNTFLHSWAWSEVEADLGRKVYRLGIFADGRQVGAFLAVVVPARRGAMVLCPHGPIFSCREPAARREEIIRSASDALREIGVREKCVCVRVCSLFPDTDESQALFASFGFRRAPIHMYSERSWGIDITPEQQTLLNGMKKNTRYGIRKAEKDGVAVTASVDIRDLETFWDVYVKTAHRQGFTVYPKALLEAEFRRFAQQGRARWYFARFKGEVVSTALILYSKTTAFYHHGASLHGTESITPGEALQWHIIRDAKSLGLRRYNFWGVAPTDAPSHPWAGLSKFKKSFGGYAEAYLHAQDLPLSPWYWMTWTIETLRKWKRNL